MLGAFFSLSAAFFWASAVILFKKSGKTFSPISLNIYKSIVAFILISATMLILGKPFFPDKPFNDWIILSASGFFGITLADLFFFTALNRLGAGIVAVVECLYLPFVLMFSFILLGESLNAYGIVGGLLVLCAIFVGAIPIKDLVKGFDSRQDIWTGIVMGFLSMFFLAIGIVIIKGVLESADVFWVTLVRVSAGIVSLLIMVIIHPKRKQYFGELKLSKAWITALPASITGNYLALLCWIAGMKYTTVSKAAILNQMSTIFIFILAAIFLKEKITVKKSVAICLAITGAWLAVFN